MKTFTLYLKKLFWKLLSLSLIVLASCEDTGTTSVVVYHNPFNTTLNIQFVDAQTGQPVGYSDNKEVSVEVLGADASLVADITGVKNSTYHSAHGFLSLGVSKNKAPSQSNPIEFTLICTSAGYLSTSYPVIISEVSHGNININLVSLTNPPDGVAPVVNSGVIVNHGVVSETHVIQTPTVASTNTRATLTIPQNAVFKDKDGAPLEGTLTTTMLYFSNIDESSLASFPGGGLMANVNMGNESNEGMFFSAGFVTIDIQDGSGRKAKTIDGTPLQLDMDISDQTYNPVTQSFVQSGDSIQLWSYEPSTGKWTLEGSAQVSSKRGSLSISASLHHLSWYNWDWFLGWDCTWNCARIVFRSNVLQNGQISYVNLEGYQLPSGTLIGSRFWQYGYYMPIDTYDGTSGVYLQYVPCNVPVQIVAKDPSGFNMGSVDVNDLCTGDHDLYLTPQSIPPSDSVTVTAYGFCPNNPLDTIFPSLGYYYRNISKNTAWVSGFMTNGHAVIYNVILNDTYLLGAYLNGTWQEYQMVVNQTDYFYSVQLTQEICDQITQ